MSEIDLTTPQKQYSVPTSRVDETGIARMGPDVKINAHNSQDAIRRVEQLGYTYNNHFEPKNVTPNRPWYEK